MTNHCRVGFVGVGRMGANMALRLRDCGYAVTAVCDIDSEGAARVAEDIGCPVAGDPSQVTAAADIILTVVSDDAAIRLAARSDSEMLRLEAERLKMGYAVLNLEKYARMRGEDLIMDRDYLRDVLGASLVYRDHEAEVWRLSEIPSTIARSAMSSS